MGVLSLHIYPRRAFDLPCGFDLPTGGGLFLTYALDFAWFLWYALLMEESLRSRHSYSLSPNLSSCLCLARPSKDGRFIAEPIKAENRKRKSKPLRLFRIVGNSERVGTLSSKSFIREGLKGGSYNSSTGNLILSSFFLHLFFSSLLSPTSTTALLIDKTAFQHETVKEFT